jgi:D-alanyl-D-alanine carboxypeptidase (penicillin-binding protein 5/6)
MGRRWPAALAVLAAGVLMVPAGPAAGDDAPRTAGRPTVDPTAPTPTAPYPGRPAQGHAPNGRTVGGEQLDTRGLVVADDTPALPGGLAASGWLVADADSGEVLAARDPHGRYYPASTLKTLTLLTLAPLLDPTRVVVATAEDENVEGSRVGLVQGGQYPVSLLFQALILQSGNDAAYALARTAGGVQVTVAAMNETAQGLGAYDTVAGTPSGLDVAGQSSSPYDLALIFRALIDDPATAAVLTTPTAQMPPRHAFVTAAQRNGRRLVVSVMGTENVPVRTADQAVLLLDWGFAVPAGGDGAGRLVEPGEQAPEPSATATSRSREAQRTPAAGAAAPEGTSAAPLVPVVLAAAALALVAATVAGRRRAVRDVPAARGELVRWPPGQRPSEGPSVGPPEGATPPPPSGGSPSTRP